MRYYIMTLVSVIVVLTIKSYTSTAQDEPINDLDLERMANYELLNHSDTVRHRKMIDRFVKSLETSEYIHGKYEGCANFENETFSSYERLERTATEQELQSLLMNQNPVVRLYAHKALVANDMKIPTDFLELSVQDSTEIVFIDGMSINKVRVMDLVSENLFQN